MSSSVGSACDSRPGLEGDRDVDFDFDLAGETDVAPDWRRVPREDALPLDSEARVFARVLDEDAALGLLSLLLRPPDFGGAFFFLLSLFFFACFRGS